MGFSDEEIERHRRASISKKKNVDEELLQARKDMLFASRTDEPEIFEARLRSQGIEPSSEKGKKAMEYYWIIRRGQQR